MSIVARSSAVQTTILPDGYVALFARDNQRIGTLPPLAAVVWEYCDGKNSIDEIVSLISEILQEGGADAGEKEITELVNLLVKEGFLQVMP